MGDEVADIRRGHVRRLARAVRRGRADVQQPGKGTVCGVGQAAWAGRRGHMWVSGVGRGLAAHRWSSICAGLRHGWVP